MGCAKTVMSGQRTTPYPETFLWALENESRLCLSGFMSAEYDDLPGVVKKEVQAFAEVNVAWLRKVLAVAKLISPKKSEPRARAIFVAVDGAQLIARSRSVITRYDALITATGQIVFWETQLLRMGDEHIGVIQQPVDQINECIGLLAPFEVRPSGLKPTVDIP